MDRDYLKTLILQASSTDLFEAPEAYAKELKMAISYAKEVYNKVTATDQEIYSAASRPKKQ